jgi:hypothetical protein
MAGQIMIVRHEAHTGLTAAFSAATILGGPVKVTGAKTVGPCTAGTDISVGVSHHEVSAAMVTAGDKATFRLRGDVIPMKSSAAITAGAKVEVAASGKVVTQSTGALFGVAWTATTGADQEVLVIVL